MAAAMRVEGILEKIKAELFGADALTHFVLPSAYDTAWTAMIPHSSNPSRPLFPQCLEWILHNQKEMGFWGDELTVDCFPSTLACIVALKAWDVGHANVQKGLHFVHEHIENLLQQLEGNYPSWFAVVFSGMVEHAWNKGLELFSQGLPQMVESIFVQRQKILETNLVPSHPYHPPLIYYLEALPPTYQVDYAEVVQHIDTDGSLFQSPSATASVFMSTKNKGCQDYLESMVQRCGCGVPPVYPIDEQLIKLCLVDRLERLGLDEQFHEKIEEVLEEVFRNWIECDSELTGIYISPLRVYKDSLAYGLLTMHGHKVSPGSFSKLMNREDITQYMDKNDVQHLGSLLSVYRASELLFPGRGQPQNLGVYAKKLLEKGISKCNGSVATNLHKEIEHELNLPWLARMDHLEHRECIERGQASDIWTGKAWYRISCLNNSLLLTLAKENYNHRQSLYKSELQELERWARESGISDIGFGRVKTTYCYFAMAATAYNPHLRTIRITGSKHGILLTIIDDFFDDQGSMDELTQFTNAVQRWDGEGIHGIGKVLFNALIDLVNKTATEAFLIQGRDVTQHLRDIWCQIIRSWLTEAEWSSKGYTPSIDEYLRVAAISVAAQTIVLPLLYLVGPIISEEMTHHPDYIKIVELVMISTRLLNDLQSYQKESEQNKRNLVLLFMQRHPDKKIEHACSYIEEKLSRSKKELLEHTLINGKNCVPKSCRKIHLIVLKIFQMFYNSTNSFDSPTAMIEVIKKAIFEPL